MQVGTFITIVFAAMVVVTIGIITLVIFPALDNNKECPTGSAICSTAAMMPGAVTILSALIVIVSIASLVFVVLYIRNHS